MKAGGFACLASLMRPADLLLPGGSPELAVAASAADSAIDHLSPQEEVRHHGHAQTWVLSARISCSAVALNRFEQIDTTFSYLGGGPRKNVFPGASGNTGLGALTTGSRVHLSESTRSQVVVGDDGRQPLCPPLSTVSKARVSGP